ncbi:hypothetical protein PPERSA_04583 [Pseudocohnilembus persalinus]|uniref:Uncharacterized protein n=1 Tax=Pseudocohnilembus persalinus TaxID=266149 RepID=A0A0V0QED7_PSEPJ|nr:hypothetical protein PPERSA_04583 [Pseudocohnilembus persalinus]|eukprot:KRX00562.1 hypothetical protein PPERSA_04583 [Pseudocohnilembus persalinus]
MEFVLNQKKADDPSFQQNIQGEQLSQLKKKIQENLQIGNLFEKKIRICEIESIVQILHLFCVSYKSFKVESLQYFPKIYVFINQIGGNEKEFKISQFIKLYRQQVIETILKDCQIQCENTDDEILQEIREKINILLADENFYCFKIQHDKKNKKIDEKNQKLDQILGKIEGLNSHALEKNSKIFPNFINKLQRDQQMNLILKELQNSRVKLITNKKFYQLLKIEENSDEFQQFQDWLDLIQNQMERVNKICPQGLLKIPMIFFELIKKEIEIIEQEIAIMITKQIDEMNINCRKQENINTNNQQLQKKQVKEQLVLFQENEKKLKKQLDDNQKCINFRDNLESLIQGLLSIGRIAKHFYTGNIQQGLANSGVLLYILHSKGYLRILMQKLGLEEYYDKLLQLCNRISKHIKNFLDIMNIILGAGIILYKLYTQQYLDAFLLSYQIISTLFGKDIICEYLMKVLKFLRIDGHIFQLYDGFITYVCTPLVNLLIW